MSAKYSQRSQCPHLGTSTTPAGHRQREGGRKGGRKRKKAGEKIKKGRREQIKKRGRNEEMTKQKTKWKDHAMVGMSVNKP